MNVLSLFEVSYLQSQKLSNHNLSRVINGDFEKQKNSFFPWIPSGMVKLEPSTGASYTGVNSIRFYPDEGKMGKVTQRTRLLQVGELYALFFAVRSLGSPNHLYVEFARKTVRLSDRSLNDKYKYYTCLFRARRKFSYLHFFVQGKQGTTIDIDTVSLYPFAHAQKVLPFAV